MTDHSTTVADIAEASPTPPVAPMPAPPAAPIAAPAMPAPFDPFAVDTTAASNTGAEIQLRNPFTNEPVDSFITVMGKDADAFRAHIRQDVDANIRREAQARRRGKNVEPTTAAEAEEKAIELLVVSTLGWRTGNRPGEFFYAGNYLPFNAGNVLRVYREQIWVRRQIDEAIGDLENFIPK